MGQDCNQDSKMQKGSFKRKEQKVMSVDKQSDEQLIVSSQPLDTTVNCREQLQTHEDTLISNIQSSSLMQSKQQDVTESNKHDSGIMFLMNEKHANALTKELEKENNRFSSSV